MYNVDFLFKVEVFIQIIESEVILRYKPRMKYPMQITLDGGECYGVWNCDEYRGRFHHKISIAIDMIESDALLFATIAHEYVHAWQMEAGLDREHDNTSFLTWAKYFKKFYGVEI